MKKTQLSFLICLLTVPLIFDATSCNKGHEHNFDTNYISDSENHWRVCTHEGCKEIIDKGNHIYDDDSDFTCNICNYIRSATKDNSIEFKSETLTYEYNHTPREIKLGEDFTVSGGTPTVSYKLVDQDDTKYTNEAPINVGDYIVKVSVEGNATYKAISETRNLTITPIILKNLTFSKPYDGNNVIRQTLDSGHGIIEGDTAIIDIKLIDASIGANKLPTSVFIYDGQNKVSNNYRIDLQTLNCTITKAVTTFSISNANLYEKIYQNTRLPEPDLTKTGIKNHTGFITNFYRINGERLIDINYGDVTKQIGNYRLVITTSDANYNYEFKKDFEVVSIPTFDIASNEFALSANETKTVLIDTGSERKIYQLANDIKNMIQIKFYKSNTRYDYYSGVLNNNLRNSNYYLGGYGKVIATITKTGAGFGFRELFNDVTWYEGNGKLTLMPLILGDNGMTFASDNPITNKAIQTWFDVKENGQGNTSFNVTFDTSKLTVFCKTDNSDFYLLTEKITRVNAASAIEFIIFSSTNSVDSFKISL